MAFWVSFPEYCKSFIIVKGEGEQRQEQNYTVNQMAY